MKPSEAAAKVDFSRIRYAQCWEDADILTAGLDIQPGDTCLSIASAGDNALALLVRDPAKVVAIDLNPAQLHCMELRLAAYRNLEHAELLQLVGSEPCEQRRELYRRCRPDLGNEAQRFWDAHTELIDQGIGAAGKFESYFRLFRRWVLPLAHSKRRVRALLQPRDPSERSDFYQRQWNNWRWRLIFRAFFSRYAMGKLGRDPRFFDYVEGTVADRILARVAHALTELQPSENPYLQWILLGRHSGALPLALRPEHFDAIRDRIHRVEMRLAPIEAYCREAPPQSIHRFNLSDIFEYMSEANFEALLRELMAAAAPGGRLAYWNMLAPRSRPQALADKLRPVEPLASELHLQDKAFFYSRFVVEEVMP